VKVITAEEHSSVLAAWWALPRRPRSLVYLDAHLDLQQISPERLRRIAGCATAEQLAALNKPHHLYPDDGFGYGIEDFLYPAHRLGLIEHIIWVAPPHVLTGYTPATFERLQQMDGVEFEELLSFRRRPEGWVAGRLLGVDLTICDYRQLAQVSPPAGSLIDIDIDFFVALPDDVPWVRPSEVFRAIAALPLRPELVTVSRSVTSGFTRLRYRFFADHLAALFEERAEDSSHFERLCDVDALHRGEQPEAAASACRSELERYPHCPATWHLLSLASGNPEEARAAQARAAELCPGYDVSVLREACEFPSRGLPLDLATVRALENRFVPGRRGAAEDALTWAALGLLHCHLGRVEAARECYRHTTRHFPNHPELASALAHALVQARRPGEALPFLEVAAAAARTAAGAHMLLGSLFANAKDVTKAQTHLRAASALAPAWTQLLELRSTLHAAVGELQQAAELRRRYGTLKQQELRLAERMRTT
jgi:tetratricopeptide (TPR) repeat protein